MAKDVKPAHTSGEVTAPKPLDRFRNYLELQAQADADATGTDFAETVIEQMLEADSFEAAVEAQDQGLASGIDMIDIPHTIHSFVTVKGDPKFESGSLLKHYVRVTDAVRHDGLDFRPYATGASNVVTLLERADREGRLPLSVVIKGRTTPNGTLLTLKLVPPMPIVP